MMITLRMTRRNHDAVPTRTVKRCRKHGFSNVPAFRGPCGGPQQDPETPLPAAGLASLPADREQLTSDPVLAVPAALAGLACLMGRPIESGYPLHKPSASYPGHYPSCNSETASISNIGMRPVRV